MIILQHGEAELLDLTRDRHESYARKFGYRYHRATGRMFLLGRPGSWPKVRFLMDALFKEVDEDEHVAFFDHDAIICRDVPLEFIFQGADLYLCPFNGYPHGPWMWGVMYFVNNERTRAFLKEVWERGPVPKDLPYFSGRHEEQQGFLVLREWINRSDPLINFEPLEAKWHYSRHSLKPDMVWPTKQRKAYPVVRAFHRLAARKTMLEKIVEKGNRRGWKLEEASRY